MFHKYIHACVCIYIYIINIHSTHSYIINSKQTILLWMRLIAINRLTALIESYLKQFCLNHILLSVVKVNGCSCYILYKKKLKVLKNSVVIRWHLKRQCSWFSVGSVNQGLFPFKTLCRVAGRPRFQLTVSDSHSSTISFTRFALIFGTIRPIQSNIGLNNAQMSTLFFNASLAAAHFVARGWCLELARLLDAVRACVRACPWVELQQHEMFLHRTADFISKRKHMAIKQE